MFVKLNKAVQLSLFCNSNASYALLFSAFFSAFSSLVPVIGIGLPNSGIIF